MRSGRAAEKRILGDEAGAPVATGDSRRDRSPLSRALDPHAVDRSGRRRREARERDDGDGRPAPESVRRMRPGRRAGSPGQADRLAVARRQHRERSFVPIEEGPVALRPGDVEGSDRRDEQRERRGDEPRTQSGDAEADPRLGGAERHSQRVGDLRVRQILKKRHPDRAPLSVRNLGERGLEPAVPGFQARAARRRRARDR